MAVKRYNGTSWDTVAGKGEQGTSSSITTWVKTASGGETSLTGSSDSSTTLAYTPGQEQLFINGVLQVRGSDYTATNGTSITGLTALVAGDIATVTTVNAFSVTGAVPLSTVTANGDLIVGTSSGAVGRLGIGSTSQVLTVSGGVPAWATPSSGGMTVIASGSLSSTSTLINSIPSTYNDLILEIQNYTTTVTGWAVDLRMNDDSTANRHYTTAAFAAVGTTAFNDTKILMTVDNYQVSSGSTSLIRVRIPSYANTTTWKIAECIAVVNGGATPTNLVFTAQCGLYNQTSAISSLRILPNSGATIGGTYTLYGVK